MTDTDPATPTVDPSRAALLVMDYQAGILAMVPDVDPLLDRAVAAIALARARGVQVVYVRVALTDQDYERVPDTNPTFALAAANRMMQADGADTAVHERVAPQPGDIVVRKTRVGPFSTTDLREQLRAKGIDTLLLAGVSTSGVVLSAVRDAADRDERLLVIEDLCFDRDPEVHAVLTERVFPRQAQIVVAADLDGLLVASGPAL